MSVHKGIRFVKLSVNIPGPAAAFIMPEVTDTGAGHLTVLPETSVQVCTLADLHSFLQMSFPLRTVPGSTLRIHRGSMSPALHP